MDIREARRRKLIMRNTWSILLAVVAAVLLIVFIISLIAVEVEKNSTDRLNSEAGTGSSTERKVDLSKVPDDLLEENFQHTAGVIYLTFDDGPGPHTARLLDILKEKNVKATFFVTGSGDDELILREHEEGHTVGLHTFTHRYDLIYTNVPAFLNDLQMIHDRVQRITGVDSRIMRFPGGSSNVVSRSYDGGARIMSTLVSEMERLGYQYFDWNISSGDAGGANSSEQVFVNVASHLKEGNNVVLMHDIKPQTVEAISQIIDFGTTNGYTFLPLKMDSFTAHHGVNN